MANLRPSRYASRSTIDPKAIREVLNATPFCTVSCVIEGKPTAIPTGFCVLGNELVIHGSIKSHFLHALLEAGDVCVSTFLFDGLVLAHSAFDHSVNYRSVVVHGLVREMLELEEKAQAIEAFTEKYVPGRWPFLRPMKEAEVLATRVLAISLEQASLKHRSGPPGETMEPWKEQVWMGVVPSRQVFGTPQPYDGQTPRALPQHVRLLVEENVKK